MKFITCWIAVFIGIWISVVLSMSVLEYRWVDPFAYFKMWTLESTTPALRLSLILLMITNLVVSLGITFRIERYLEENK